MLLPWCNILGSDYADYAWTAKTWGEAWQEAIKVLATFSAEPEAEARWFFQHVEISPQDCRFRPLETLAPSAALFLEEALRRRLAREPLQHILGTQPFRHLELSVNRDVLIPRPETEQLVDYVLAACYKKLEQGVAVRILDVGTGSGAIALALKQECPELDVWASDLSEPALATARFNAKALNLGVHFIQGDGLHAVLSLPQPQPRFDILVSNPPYIPATELPALAPEVRDYEPVQALVPPMADPLYFYRHFAQWAPEILTPHGKVFFEIHSALGRETTACFAAPLWIHTRLYQDFQKKDRYVESEFGRVIK